MDTDERDFLDALESSLPEGERFQAALQAFYRLIETHTLRLTPLITARAHAARLEPAEVVNRTFSDAVKHLRKQVAGEKSFAFKGDPPFQGWLMSIVGDVRRKSNGGVIPTMLREQDRTRNREESFDEKHDLPDEPEGEIVTMMKNFNLEERL